MHISENIEDGVQKISGLKQVRVHHGVAVFNDLTFSAYPNTSNVEFKIYSSSIDSEYLSSIFPEIEES